MSALIFSAMVMAEFLLPVPPHPGRHPAKKRC
jgi:hypothetical protein